MSEAIVGPVPARWRSVRELLSGNGGAWTSHDSVLAAVAYALLGGVTTIAVQDGDRPLLLVAALVAAVAGLRAVWLATGYGRAGSARLDQVMFAGHTGLVAALCTLEPVFGFYAWIGFIDAAAVLGRWTSLVGIGVTALLVALSEIGGVDRIADEFLIFTVLLVINVVIPWTLGQFMGQMQLQSEERRRMILQLERTMRENAVLHGQLIEQAEEAGRLDERARVARELHDTVAQGLIGIVTQLEAAEQDADWSGRGARARNLARSSLVEARRAVAALSDPTLTHGLAFALDEACWQWSAVNKVPVQLRTVGPERPVGCAAQLLRICQESLANAGRHAAPNEVQVALTYQEGAVQLEVTDDGAGFDPAAARWGYGVAGMRQRALACGGDFALRTTPGEGTTVRVTVPRERSEVAR